MRLALAAAAVLAGCLAPADPGGPASSAGPLAWAIADCAFVIAQVPVDGERLAARLPEGFALAEGSPLAALPAGPRAAISLDAYHCARGAWGATGHVDISYGSHYVGVAPPDALREDGYDAYFVKWDPLVADDAARAQLAAAGMAARDGEARVVITPASGGALVEGSLVLDDGSGFALRGVAGEQEAQGAPLPFIEFTPLAGGGLARWHARLHDASIGSGAGVVELPEGSWVRELVGAPRASAMFIAGTWNLDEADVTAG